MLIYKMGVNASDLKKIQEKPEETIEKRLIRLIEEERTKLRENRVEEEKLDTRLTEINTEIQTLASFMYPKITEDQVIEFYKKQNPNKIESLESDYNKLKKEKDTIVSNIEKLDKKIDELKRIKLAEALRGRKLTNNKPYYPNMRNHY